MRRQSRRQFVRRSLALAGLAMLSGCGLAALARTEPNRVARVGFLTPASPQAAAPNLEAFRDGMRAHGFEEGQDYVLEVRYAEGSDKRLPDLAAELITLPVDVILAGGTTPTTAAKHATAITPIVMTGIGPDPVALGLVASLARPGGNVTGVVNLNGVLAGKRVDLLKETLPPLARLAVLQELANPGNDFYVEEAQTAARALGIQVLALPLHGADDLEAAFDAATRGRADALLVPSSSILQLNQARIVGLAAQHRLPAMYQQREHAEHGGLMVYAADLRATFRNVATYVFKILKGAKPGDLPIEQATTFDFVINLKTARELGLTIPPSVLQQATEIIQ